MASAPCRECDSSSSRCDGCRRSFCHYHLTEHQQKLRQQFDNLLIEHSNLKEILSLPPSYESLTECNELITKINQWEIDTIEQIKQIAEQTREKLRHRSDTIATERFGTEFQQLTEQLQEYQRRNHFNESHIQQLTTEINDLKIQIENALLTTADIRIIPIDWTKSIQIIINKQKIHRNQRTIRFDRLITTRPRISVDVRNAEWHILGIASALNSTFLYYQHRKKHKLLSLIDINGQQKSIPWSENQSIWDICWSSYHNKFLILADNCLYTYDQENSLQLIESIRPKRNEMEFLRCTCSDELLLITYDERNSSIDQYDIKQWSKTQQYENILKHNEIIVSIAISETNPNLIGCTVLDDKQHWHFELRDKTMTIQTILQLDKSEFNRRLICLPNSNMHWLIIHTGSKFLSIIDQNAQNKQTIECGENIDLATFIPEKNSLVLLTQKDKLKFFDL